MITAKLMKNLEREGFTLNFPEYSSSEEMIREILQENNERLRLALPLLFRSEFDYEKIKKNLPKKNLSTFNRLILISNNIFIKEKLNNRWLKEIIKKQSLKQKINKDELNYYHDSFKEFNKNKEINEEKRFKEQIDLRGKLNINQALSRIYSPGKLLIMAKIFDHEPLTNTELKYYYRSIRPFILAILNENLQKYLRLIESTKKYS